MYLALSFVSQFHLKLTAITAQKILMLYVLRGVHAAVEYGQQTYSNVDKLVLLEPFVIIWIWDVPTLFNSSMCWSCSCTLRWPCANISSCAFHMVKMILPDSSIGSWDLGLNWIMYCGECCWCSEQDWWWSYLWNREVKKR